MKLARHAIAAVLLLALFSPAAARRRRPPPPPPDKQPWWNKAWPYRARIILREGPGTNGYFTLNLYGRAQPDRRDLRLVDAQGKPVNFRVVSYRPEEHVLVQMQVPEGKALTAWLYHGKADAAAINTAKSNPDAPAWDPKAGIVRRTYAKKTPGHPESLGELQEMIRAAGKPQRSAFVSKMSHGLNPNGESDHYISVHQGYLNIAAAGVYTFRAYANDGCWILIDDQEVLAWPGPRDESRGPRTWRRDFKVELTPGVHRIDYFHEEGEGRQMAYLEWQPPDGKEPLPIPGGQWRPVRRAAVDEFRAADRPIVAAPATWLRHTFWVPGTEQQVNMLAVQGMGKSLAGKIVKTEYTFDDGSTIVDDKPHRRHHHIVFANGNRRVTCTITDEHGNKDSAMAVIPVWQINAAGGHRYELPRGWTYQQLYLTILEGKTYDVAKLTQDDLAGYAVFWAMFDKMPWAMAAVHRLFRERPDHPSMLDLALIGSRAALRDGGDPELAAKLVRLVREDGAVAKRIAANKKRLASTVVPSVRAKLEGRIRTDEKLLRDFPMIRAHLLAWSGADYAGAAEIYDTVYRERLRQDPPDLAMARRARIGRGDVYLLQADYGKAEDIYRRAQKVGGKALTRAQKLAKGGDHPFRVRDYLARDLPEQALQAIDKWENELPVAKLEGLTFFLRGKVLYTIGPTAAAAKFLELAERVNPQALHVPEAVWLRANCLMATGKYQAAKVQFLRLSEELTDSAYLDKAVGKIEECKAKLAAKKPAAGD